MMGQRKLYTQTDFMDLGIFLSMFWAGGGGVGHRLGGVGGGGAPLGWG